MGFENIKDLVRGTIVADVTQLWESYEHFKTLEGVEIIEIKSLKKVEMLQNITILFVYQHRFIGEMQIRFGQKPSNYEANHFIYEIARSEMTLEILQSLHKKEIELSDAGRIAIGTMNNFARLDQSIRKSITQDKLDQLK
jgi:hypothetical protein